MQGLQIRSPGPGGAQKSSGDESSGPFLPGESFEQREGRPGEVTLQRMKAANRSRSARKTSRAWRNLRKQSSYVATLVTSSITNIPFPTNVDPFPDHERARVKSLLKPGDIILQKDEHCPIMQTVSKAATGSDFVHAALYIGGGHIVESVVEGVRKGDVDVYLQGKNSIQVIRPGYKTRKDRDAAIAFARKQIGKPYNVLFSEKSDESFYCTQLVREALRSMPHPLEVPVSSPGGKEVVGTRAFQEMKDRKVIYSLGGDFKDSMKATRTALRTALLYALFVTLPSTLTKLATTPALRAVL